MSPPSAEPGWLRALETLACVALAAMLVLTMADVVGRYILARPVKGVTELVQYTMVLVVFAGLPVVTARREHISVGVLDKLFKGNARRVHMALILLASAAILFAQAWVLFRHAQGMQQAADVIGALRLPVHPAGYVMAALSALAGLLCVAALRQPENAAATAAH